MDPLLLRLVRGQLRCLELPPLLDLACLHDGLAELCGRSFEVPSAEQVEWGACLGLRDGAVALVHLVRGLTAEVTPGCRRDDPRHGMYVGFSHTHLPDPGSGRPYLGFSELDFRATLADGSNVELVCNGPEVYAFVRAADRTQLP